MLTLNSWVFSSELASLGLSTYNSSVSKTSRFLEGYTFQICYADRTCVIGDVYTETISAGGITVENQIIGGVKGFNENFVRLKVQNGILGLSFNPTRTGEN